MSVRARIFNIMQYLEHPETKDKLIDEDTIKQALMHKSISDWAYILHDKDTYTEENCKSLIAKLKKKNKGKKLTDEEKKEQDDKIQEYKEQVGKQKAPHYHIVIRARKSAIALVSVSKWFGVPENFIDIPKGRGAFLDCVEYLTHESETEQLNGKHLYSDEEVKSSFNFREELEKMKKYDEHNLKSERDILRFNVLYEGKTLKWCSENNFVQYMNDLQYLQKLRHKYLTTLTPPKYRTNYYISGGGGVGKSLLSYTLARAHFPNLTDDELFFEVGAKNVSFEGYDGQPVLIWNDFRAFNLLEALNGRGNVFNVFEVIPRKQKQNVKYGSIGLVHAINIVNSPQSYKDFVNGISGEYDDKKSGITFRAEDKTQIRRRFLTMFHLRQEDFDILFNSGLLNDTDLFDEYIEYNNIRGNFGDLARALDPLSMEFKQYTNKMLAIPLSVKDKIDERRRNKALLEAEEVKEISRFEDFGTIDYSRETKEDLEALKQLYGYPFLLSLSPSKDTILLKIIRSEQRLNKVQEKYLLSESFYKQRAFEYGEQYKRAVMIEVFSITYYCLLATGDKNLASDYYHENLLPASRYPLFDKEKSRLQNNAYMTQYLEEVDRAYEFQLYEDETLSEINKKID